VRVFYVLLRTIYFSTCFFLIALRLYSYLLHFSTCLKVYPFSMQVIDQDEPRQGIIGVLAEGDAPEESY
jgi:hypothetical protein